MSENNDGIELEILRERLRSMSDAELVRFDEAASACSARATAGQTLKAAFRTKLEETRLEWKRRHPLPA